MAHDLGQMLGSGAHLRNLVRTRSGPFTIDDSISVPQLEGCFGDGKSETIIHPPDFVLSHLDSVIVDEANEDSVIHGRPFAVVQGLGGFDGESRRVYSFNGRFLALAKFDQNDGLWKPVKVFA